MEAKLALLDKHVYKIENEIFKDREKVINLEVKAAQMDDLFIKRLDKFESKTANIDYLMTRLDQLSLSLAKSMD